MTATSAALSGRVAAEALMVDACTISAPGATEVYDPGTDTYQTPAGALRYTGACKVTPSGNSDREVEAGAATVSLWPYKVAVPMSATSVQDDDVVTITASPLDPSLVGVKLRVRSVAQGSYLTARRLGCERQT